MSDKPAYYTVTDNFGVPVVWHRGTTLLDVPLSVWEGIEQLKRGEGTIIDLDSLELPDDDDCASG